MSVNDKIQLVRFYARFAIAIVAMSIFGYIVHVMMMASDEMATSSKDLLNILIGAFIPILAGIAKFYFESGGDLHHHVQLKKEMKMNPIFLINIIKSLILDKAQDLAVEHVTKAIDDNLDDTQKALLDAAIEEMPDNTFKNIKELLS